MFNLPIFESIWDKEIVAGYSLSSFAWWIDLIIIGIAVLLIGTMYFLMAWAFGRFKFTAEDKEAFANYRKSDRKAKKEQAKAAKGPLKSVITWHRMKPWFIPVVSSVLVITMLATPILYTTWDILMTTISGSKTKTYDTEEAMEAAALADENVVTIEGEGIVLLKNKNNALPLDVSTEEGKKINVFGSAAFGLLYGNGGSGSFQTDGRYSAFPRVAKKLEVALGEEGFEINQYLFNMIKNYYATNRNSNYSVADRDYDIQCGVNTYNYSEVVPTKEPVNFEAPIAAYTKTYSELGDKSLLDYSTDYSDTALYVITRRGSEDGDMNVSGGGTLGATLMLTDTEKQIIQMLEDNFEKVIILFNVPTVCEAEFVDDDGIDAAVFIGHPGLTGTTAVAQVLNGKINPSGHLVDTWPRSMTSAPSYQNFGNATTLTHTGASTGRFVEYIENIYVGYRYYVTRGMVDDDFDYDDEVRWSFGYGLSYTTFDKSIVEFKVDKTNQKVEVGVEVKNTGNVAGKDVVEIYFHAPYYEDYGIEKSWFTLIGFTKTNVLQPNESKNYKIEFTFREMASWSTADGFYLLEHGDYEVSLREDVWNIAQTSTNRQNARTFNIAQDIEFTRSYQTGAEYQNLFQDVEWGANNAEKIKYLSRSDFAGTWQNTNQINRTATSDKFPGGTSNQQGGQNFNFSDNQIEGDTPTMGANNGLTLRDFKDADWDDEGWDDLLDQLSRQELFNIVDQGSFRTTSISSIGKAQASDYDGPSSAYHSGTGHPSEVIVACSWNVNVATLMGESIGREGASRGLTGWYAPGINTHRNPCGGRNFEYYSEDPLIAGQMAGHTAQGSMKYGVYTYAKHFLLNEQEANRAGVFTWCSEQALREIYARGFEIYVDLGGIGIMSSFNCVGSWWAGASKALLTDLLRTEWGFHGVVITDYVSSPYMAVNIGIRAGNDLWLNKNPSCDAQHAYNQTQHDTLILLRRAAKNILYACAHSNNVWDEADYQAVGLTKPA